MFNSFSALFSTLFQEIIERVGVKNQLCGKKEFLDECGK